MKRLVDKGVLSLKDAEIIKNILLNIDFKDPDFLEALFGKDEDKIEQLSEDTTSVKTFWDTFFSNHPKKENYKEIADSLNSFFESPTCLIQKENGHEPYIDSFKEYHNKFEEDSKYDENEKPEQDRDIRRRKAYNKKKYAIIKESYDYLNKLEIKDFPDKKSYSNGDTWENKAKAFNPNIINMGIICCLPKNSSASEDRDKINVNINCLSTLDKMYDVAERVHIRKLLKSLEESVLSSSKNSDLSANLYKSLKDLSNDIDKGNIINEFRWVDLYKKADQYLTYKTENGYNSRAYGKIYAADAIMKLSMSRLQYGGDLINFDNNKPNRDSITAIINNHKSKADTDKVFYNKNKLDKIDRLKTPEHISYSKLLKEEIKNKHRDTKTSKTKLAQTKQKNEISI